VLVESITGKDLQGYINPDDDTNIIFLTEILFRPGLDRVSRYIGGSGVADLGASRGRTS
jgi:hypothetical protein